jgi:hypothetical protein
MLMTTARVRAGVAAALLGLAVAGCSASPSSRSDASVTKPRAAAGGSARQPAAPQASSGTASTPLQQRDIVRTATVTLHTSDVDRTADTIAALADPVGGRVDGDDRNSSGHTRTATLVLRVPPNALNRIIARVDALGTETGRSVRGQDVTARRADITARAAALQTSVGRLQSFLSHSGSITSLVSLENQLTQRESELESMQAQQRALADEITLATLTVRLSTTPKQVPPKTPAKAGLGAAFVSGWHALTTAARWLIKIVGYSLPITAVAALIAGVFVFAWRRRQRHNPPEPTTE